MIRQRGLWLKCISLLSGCPSSASTRQRNIRGGVKNKTSGKKL